MRYKQWNERPLMEMGSENDGYMSLEEACVTQDECIPKKCLRNNNKVLPLTRRGRDLLGSKKIIFIRFFSHGCSHIPDN